MWEDIFPSNFHSELVEQPFKHVILYFFSFSSKVIVWHKIWPKNSPQETKTLNKHVHRPDKRIKINALEFFLLEFYCRWSLLRPISNKLWIIECPKDQHISDTAKCHNVLLLCRFQCPFFHKKENKWNKRNEIKILKA